jgi:hypothetical protein
MYILNCQNLDMIENALEDDEYFKGKHYDVGIAEYSLPSQYAFAVYDALNIKHWVVSRGLQFIFNLFQ